MNQTQLPPLGGVQGAPEPSLSGQPVLGGQQSQNTMSQSSTTGASMGGSPGGMQSGTMGSTTQTASLGGSGVSLDPLASSASSGPEGVWTVNAGASQCRLNLPLTTREGTSRYRASAPGCSVSGLASVGSWQQVGNQIQLFDESNNLVAAMAQSGSGYSGTLSGGQSVSMQR